MWLVATHALDIKGGCSPHANPSLDPNPPPRPNPSHRSHPIRSSLQRSRLSCSARSAAGVGCRGPPGSESMVPRIFDSSGFVPARPVAASSSPDKKGRVPKKIHKAEREKLKRDHLNELYQELYQAIDSGQQNSGKAVIVGDATKLLHDLISQVDSLRRENVTLQKESRYITVERNELKDENTALVEEVERLKMEIRDRMQSSPSWSTAAAPSHISPPQSLPTTLPLQPPPMVGSAYVPPVQNHQLFSGSIDPTAHIRRPHARYPTQIDSWPYQFLSQQPAAGSNGGSGVTDDGEAEEAPSSPKELLLLI